jgi:isoquinoline 1-oxidoreductase beta subunit
MLPVKTTWRREEDLAHDQYRPFALVNVKAKLNAGRIAAWSYRNVSQSILGQRGWMAPGTVDSQAVEGAVQLPYDLGTHIVEWVPLPVGIPVGFWRSVGSSINAFVIESMMDELARVANIDPFTFRDNHLVHSSRFKAVLHAADIMTMPWRTTLPAGHAWGMAIAESFDTVVCEVVEISRPAADSISGEREPLPILGPPLLVLRELLRRGIGFEYALVALGGRRRRVLEDRSRAPVDDVVLLAALEFDQPQLRLAPVAADVVSRA